MSSVLTAGLTAATAIPAQAATTGASCKLSANWQVKFSAAYDQPGNSSYVRYAVMNSPGPIRQLQLTVLDSHGNVLGGTGPLTNPDQVTRIDIYDTFLLPTIHMRVWGGNNNCNAYLYPYSV
ncbi:hypothetical protein [Actinoplanes sp. NPDC049599]|uniref:hypothetical protein n=1 Tax=Actinoplanes sp. NPDC049599 TaxID=3363903 RepID=UPI00379A2493